MCGANASLHAYFCCGDIWYYYKCPICGNENELHYNVIINALYAWNIGEIINNDNSRL